MTLSSRPPASRTSKSHLLFNRLARVIDKQLYYFPQMKTKSYIKVLGLFFGVHFNNSLTDCISFATMRKLGIDTALAFDRCFMQAGFQVLPCQPV